MTLEWTSGELFINGEKVADLEGFSYEVNPSKRRTRGFRGVSGTYEATIPLVRGALEPKINPKGK